LFAIRSPTRIARNAVVALRRHVELRHDHAKENP
jgi:hypothetical protein